MSEHFNLLLFHFVNGWAGNPILDSVAIAADRFVLLKGGISLAAFWWFWFYGDRQRNRRLIILAFFGVIGAIVISRALTLVLPFHARPMYTPDIGYQSPSIPFTLNAEDWSSFPSDNAAMWFALSFGLWKLSRPVGVIAVIYSAIWVCLVRVYLGAHYPADVILGGIIGWISGWLTMYMPLTPIIDFALKIEERAPYMFYPAMFLCSYELTSIFDDVRVFMRAIHMIHGGHIVVYVLAIGFVVGVLFSVISVLDRKRLLSKKHLQN